MILRGQLHIHTTCSDGELTPQEVANAYADLGLDFIAFTDHDHLINSDYEKNIMQVRSELIMFHGVELTVFEKGYFHLNKIVGEQEMLHIFNHPAEHGLKVKQVIERLQLLSQKYPIDAVEITSHGFYTEEFDIPEIGYPKLASDDSHSWTGCCRAWIEVESNRDKDSILRAIKRGDFRNCYA